MAKRQGEIEIGGEKYAVYLPIGAIGLFAEVEDARRNNDNLKIFRIMLETVRLCVPDLPDSVYSQTEAEEFVEIFAKLVETIGKIVKEKLSNPTA